METCFNLLLCSSSEMSVFSSLRKTQLMTLFTLSVLLSLCSKDVHYPKKDMLSFNMRSAGKFYLMMNQMLINAEDRIGFQQNMERLSFEETVFSHSHSTCEADIW